MACEIPLVLGSPGGPAVFIEEENTEAYYNLKLEQTELLTCDDCEPQGQGVGMGFGAGGVSRPYHKCTEAERKCDYTQQDCGCNCNAALREYLQDCYDLGVLPPLKNNCQCGQVVEEAPVPRKPRCEAKCTLEPCDFSFVADPNCKCPPMPCCDTSGCRPTWMPCPAPITHRMYEVPEDEVIIPYSAGLTGGGGKVPGSCPMSKHFNCYGVNVDGVEKKSTFLCTIKNKIAGFFQSKKGAAPAGEPGKVTVTEVKSQEVKEDVKIQVKADDKNVQVKAEVKSQN